jgi:hypothetical protein
MPFTTEQFFDVFRLYNIAVQPAQMVLSLLAVAAIALIFVRGGGRVIFAILALLWLWMGAVYHLYFFARINTAAYAFAAFFIVQAGIFIYEGVYRRQIVLGPRYDLRGAAGSVFIIYPLVLYPLLGQWAGHEYPATPTFGAPCPTTIFTFGILMFSAARLPVLVYAIPFVWSLIGATAAVLLDVPQDLGLLAAGVIGALLLYKQR